MNEFTKINRQSTVPGFDRDMVAFLVSNTVHINTLSRTNTQINKFNVVV